MSTPVSGSLLTGDDDTPEIMLSDADIAMYQAKDLGRGRAEMCDEAMRKTSVNRLGMETACSRGAGPRGAPSPVPATDGPNDG